MAVAAVDATAAAAEANQMRGSTNVTRIIRFDERVTR